MSNAFEVLKARGFLFQTTHDEELAEHLEQPRRFYIGFDPTADSLHVGSLVPIMAMMHMQAEGHMPYALVGSGTARVGDPSGKTEMRQMLNDDTLSANARAIQKQLSRYLILDGEKGHLINNESWLLDLDYIGFLREIGVHFSVNRMLTAESVKLRLETGLNFIEFNYMLLQAFDYYVLARDHQCSLQMGGQDQWGNIVAGIDLIRRKGLNTPAFGFTLPLITNASGAKFGKSVSGNVWLDARRTSVFDFYQFWRNTEDADVARFLRLFTFLPLQEIDRVTTENINRAKEILAFEATAISHGMEEARRCFSTAVARFGAADPHRTVVTSSAIKDVDSENLVDPAQIVELSASELEGMTWADLYMKANLVQSKSEARRLVQGKGARYFDQVIEDANETVKPDFFEQDRLTLRAGKKRFKTVLLS